MMKSFTDLEAWQEGHKLVMVIYFVTKTFPREEIFGLTIQLRRAVVSITSNLAEGFTRQSLKEKVQFYSMAQASLSEVQNQLLIARDVKYLPVQKFDEIAQLSIKVHKIITGLILSIKKKYAS